jgi:flagellar motor switch protein FliM
MTSAGQRGAARAAFKPARKSVVRVNANVASWTCGEKPRVPEEQMSAMHMTHEALAHNLAVTLSAYLRSSFTVSLDEVQEAVPDEFAKDMADPAYVATLRLGSPEALGVLHLELPLATTILDLLLGGDGSTDLIERDLTDIETEILRAADKLIAEEIEKAWQLTAGVRCQAGRRIRPAETAQVLRANKRLLVSKLKMEVGPAQGTLTLAFPEPVLTLILRKLNAKAAPRPAAAAPVSPRLRERVMDCRFLVEMTLPGMVIAARDLMALEPGGVLVLRHHTEQPGLIGIAGQPKFTAYPVRHGPQRGARIVECVEPRAAAEEEKL